MIKDLVKKIAGVAWTAAANSYRMYPDNKHTFDKHWDETKSLYDSFSIDLDTPSELSPLTPSTQFEIHIGEVWDDTSKTYVPKNIIIINKEQFIVIEQFASTRKDSELNTVYKLNDCEFKIVPHLNTRINFGEIEDCAAHLAHKK